MGGSYNKCSLAILGRIVKMGVRKLEVDSMFLNTDTLVAELCAMRFMCEGLNLDLELL